MCGIVGVSLSANHSNAESVVREMSARITHRGPDSDGYLASPSGRSHVGFRRLAIRDLDARANQPMVSASGRTAIVFNGEVYNSAELAHKHLSNVELRTSGDTEVVLECIERVGLEILPELNGMFAMAIIDLQSDRMTLVRDRMGKKPLYVYEHSERNTPLIAFSSELRSLKPFGLQPNPQHIELFFHFGYFPSPYTFFADTTQVCPGEVVHLEEGRIAKRERYHQFASRRWSSSDAISLAELDALFTDSVRLRKLSDVPVGAFLSGGIDSALVAAYLNQHNASPTPTFTIAFSDQRHNEAGDAADTAEELSLPHQVIEIPEQDLAELAAQYIDCYEQPYADSSGLVTMLLCNAVKQHVTVALSGDGGDEFFGGYARYSWFRKGLTAQKFPRALRRLAGFGLSAVDPRRGKRLSRWLRARDPAELYTEILRTWNSSEADDIIDGDVRSSASVRPHELVREVFDQTDADPLAGAACFDATYYIPDDLQVKLDRAAMRVALEVRCPLLDYRIANHGLALRSEQKYSRWPEDRVENVAAEPRFSVRTEPTEAWL